MGKRSREERETSEEKTNGTENVKGPLLVDEKAVDPGLAALFASSAGPVKAPSKARYEEPPPPRRQKAEVRSDSDGDEDEDDSEDSGSEGDDEELSSIDGDLEDTDLPEESDESEEEAAEGQDLDRLIEAITKPDRKRKRKPEEEDLEGKYLHKLAKEEEKEEEERQTERRLKRQKLLAKKGAKKSEGEEDPDEDMENGSDDEEGSSDDGAEQTIKPTPSDVPLHESLAPDNETTELEKATRTVFLANVSTSAITSKTAKKTLLAHMSSFFPEIAAPLEGKPGHKVESLRFRSTAFAGTSLPKKAAFAKKELMEATTKSTNAYVVYSSAFAAREAAKRLNGTIVFGRHLRVDGVAHPAKTDHRRCVFVGNLGFVDDESMIDAAGENERKRSKIPSDVEEGLWRQFNKAGKVESVRVVRDEKTRVGKGFAYVQFEDSNAIEAALLFNEKKYPPMLPRVLRVVRAKAIGKTAKVQAAASSRDKSKNSKNPNKQQIYNPKLSSHDASLQGRAGKLLGRAGAAQFKKREGSGANETVMGNRGDAQRSSSASGIPCIAKTPESIVFEGYRASAKTGKPKDLKMGGGGGKKGKGKLRTRTTKRSSDWKKTGGKSK